MTPEKLGQMLSKKRKEKKVTAYSVYNSGAVSKGTVANLENGKGLKYLVAYCNAVGLKIIIEI